MPFARRKITILISGSFLRFAIVSEMDMDKKCKLCVSVFTLAVLFKEKNVDTKAGIWPAIGLKKLRSESKAE